MSSHGLALQRGGMAGTRALLFRFRNFLRDQTDEWLLGRSNLIRGPAFSGHRILDYLDTEILCLVLASSWIRRGLALPRTCPSVQNTMVLTGKVQGLQSKMS